MKFTSAMSVNEYAFRDAVSFVGAMQSAVDHRSPPPSGQAGTLRVSVQALEVHAGVAEGAVLKVEVVRLGRLYAWSFQSLSSFFSVIDFQRLAPPAGTIKPRVWHRRTT